MQSWPHTHSALRMTPSDAVYLSKWWHSWIEKAHLISNHHRVDVSECGATPRCSVEVPHHGRGIQLCSLREIKTTVLCAFLTIALPTPCSTHWTRRLLFIVDSTMVFEREAAWVTGLGPTDTPISRARSPHSQSEGPDLVQAEENDNPIVLAKEPAYKSSYEEGHCPVTGSITQSPMQESPTQSKPRAEDTAHDAPTEVVTEA